jgi:S-adenosylmethionine:tRNA ribosyltransferase-isomerase
VRTTDYDFELPPERIAAIPAARRDGSRLLLMDRLNGSCKHEHFHNLPRLLPPRSLLVLNDTRVIAARLRARKPTGGAIEFLLTRSVDRALEAGGVVETWEALARGLGRITDHASGPAFVIGPRLTATVVEPRSDGRVLLRLHALGVSSVLEILDDLGEIPLPPYIEAARKSAGAAVPAVDDRQRYQTVYAAAPGAVAAPTAGLHFTPALLDQVREAGHEVVTVTLHVGPGTFRPVKTEDPRLHELDEERYDIPAATAGAIERARGAGRAVVAVGTTVVRALEASARAHAGRVVAGDAATTLLILPGDPFRVVSGLVTNFHLPRSSLLMLVAAFAGRDPVLAAYREAVAREYRFYSYGDAMLICETGW